MRGDALGILGHPDVRTPNLDRIAREGVLFENYFVNNPVCAPSRMSVHSGLYPHQHGSISNVESVRLTSTDNTLLGFFKDRGYKLGWFGKDNHAYSRDVLNETLDANTSRRREAFRAYNAYVPPHWHSDTPWPKEELFPIKTTDDAIKFIENTHEEAPFFAILSLFDPHPPYFAPAAYAAHYPPEKLTLPVYVDPATLSPRLDAQKHAMLYDRMDEADLRATMAYYYAAIEWGVDYQVGRLLDTLEREGITENTIVIFTADHGDFMGEFGMIRKGMYLYDALLHVPFIWYAPGRITSGYKSSVLAQGVDVFPTLLDLVDEPDGKGLPGRSLKPFLMGEEEYDPNHTIFAMAGYGDLPDDYFEHPEKPYFDPPGPESIAFHTRIYDITMPPRFKTAMARNAEWKLILSETHPPELYRMNGEWQEKENLAGVAEYQSVYDDLYGQINRMWRWE